VVAKSSCYILTEEAKEKDGERAVDILALFCVMVRSDY
jgi:hypothetical protein